MLDDKTPILVGAGQLTQKVKAVGEALAPIDLMAEAARRALADTGAGPGLAAAIDTMAVIRFVADSSDSGRFKLSMYRNPPLSLARRIGANPAQAYYSAAGGNTPQYLINDFAERIARGEIACAMIAASECLDTMVAAGKQGVTLDWHEDADSDPLAIGVDKPGHSPHERLHNMHLPANVYPLFETAIRGARGRSPAEHQIAMGRLFARFTEVAAANPHAWYPTARSAEEIATASDRNRIVGFPYTKYMNAMIFVDMAAALVITSVGEARRRGIPQDRWVFLHGCGDANDRWFVSDRVNYHSSPAIRAIARTTFDMAGKTPADLDLIDLYSCFPSAVEIGAAEIGLAEDDPRGLTVTGGLPYFGGPGNNYVVHSIATMVERLRARPGAFGLVTANGWYVTKHSMGLYSTTPTKGPWRRADPAADQRAVDAMSPPPLVERPEGPARVETYTVVHTHSGPSFGIVIGRLESGGQRFLSLVPRESGALARMEAEDMLNRPGRVTAGAGDAPNLFAFG